MAGERDRILIDVDLDLASKAILLQMEDTPVFAGQASVDLACSACGHRIAFGVRIQQLHDICIICGRCGVQLRTPHGHAPLGSIRKAITQTGRYRAETSTEVDEETVFTSQENLARQEANLRRLAGLDEPEGTLDFQNPEDLDRLLTHLKAAIGPFYADLLSREKRAQARGAQRPHHRLAWNVLRVQDTIASLRQDPVPNIHLDAIMEVEGAVALIKRWRTLEIAPIVDRAFRHPPEYLHTFITLAFASTLAAGKNDIRLLPPEPMGRSSDLRLAVTAKHAISVEVKTPEALAYGTPISPASAQKLVAKCLKKAGTNHDGQLDPSQSGILIIGGAGLRDADLNALDAAASAHLRETGKTRPHLAGISTASYGVVGHTDEESTSFRGAINIRWAPNPYYSGDSRLVVDDGGMQRLQHLASYEPDSPAGPPPASGTSHQPPEPSR